jgi:ABC-2 type transport system permease protein
VSTGTLPETRRTAGLALLAGQVRYQLRILLRSPLGAFFTLALPLMLLVVLYFAAPPAVTHALGETPFARFFTPAMVVFAILSSCYVDMINAVTNARDDGVLKRLRGTPLPPWLYVAGRVVAASCVAAVSAALVITVGVIAFDVTFQVGRLGALVVVVLVAMICCSALGLCMTVLIPSADAAIPVSYGTLLPIAFISDVFYPSSDAPEAIRRIASVFPLVHLARAAEATFDPADRSWPLTPSRLAIVAGWTLAAVTVAVLRFRWEPRSRNE